MKEILDSQPQEKEVLNEMTSDVNIELIGSEEDWEKVDIIQETQVIQEEIMKDKEENEKKKKEKGKEITPMVPRAPVPTLRIDSKEEEKKKYKQMRLR
jgi:hypothetical protein